MTSRRNSIKTLALAGVASAVGGCAAWARSRAATTWQYFPAGESGFYRAPVLLSGKREAVLIDGGFTLSDGQAVAQAIRATGRRLTTIYVSQADPDYYFSLGPIVQAFPEARVVASPETVVAINRTVDQKLEIWGPQLKANGPQRRADIIMPRAFDADSFELEGHAIHVVTVDGLQDRRYLWVPHMEAVLGGVLTFSGVHVWTADTPSPESRAAWVAALDRIIERRPRVLVPGHLAVDAPMGLDAVRYTRNYLLAFEEARQQAANSTQLIAAMKHRYPTVGMSTALQIGAQVAMGETVWD